MPIVRRSNKKAEKIAFDIIGVPMNMQSKKTPEQKKLDQILSIQSIGRTR